MSEERPGHAPRALAKLRRVVDLSPSMTALEVGCGLGLLTRVLAPEVARLTALDVSPHAIAQARAAITSPNTTFVTADALSWRTRGKFDLVLALAVFEHFHPAEQARFFLRARTWLAPAGRLVLHVPIAESWSASRRTSRRNTDGPDYTGDPTHHATFSCRSLRAALARGGFAIEKEWIRFSRLGWPPGWAAAVMKAMPPRWREAFAMEMVVAARATAGVRREV